MKNILIILIAFLLLPVLFAPVQGQDVFEDTRGVPVTERPRPDYDPLGIRAGAFLILPELALGLEYNDNVYATKDNEESDLITVIAPKVDFRSDWTRHAITGSVGLRGGIYGSNSDENYFDAFALLNTRLDVLQESFLDTRLGVLRQHEERGDPNFPITFKEPVVYYRSFASARYSHGLGRLSLRTGAGLNNYNYQSVELTDGTTFSQDLRDYNRYDLNARLAYELLPNVQPFIEGQYELRRYAKSEALRDSDGFRFGLGAGFDLGGVTTGEIFGGYLHQNYKDRENQSSFWGGLSLLWNPTLLTSVQARVVNTIQETTQAEASGINTVALGLRLDHELLRNLLVGAFIDYTYDDYIGASVKDNYVTVGPRLAYLWNRNFKAEFEYAYIRKSGDEIYQDNYTQNRFMVSISASF